MLQYTILYYITSLGPRTAKTKSTKVPGLRRLSCRETTAAEFEATSFVVAVESSRSQ